MPLTSRSSSRLAVAFSVVAFSIACLGSPLPGQNAIAALKAQDAIAALMAPGVPSALAVYRAARVRDVRYEITLDVSTRDTATGTVTVRFVRRGTGDGVNVPAGITQFKKCRVFGCHAAGVADDKAGVTACRRRIV